MQGRIYWGRGCHGIHTPQLGLCIYMHDKYGKIYKVALTLTNDHLVPLAEGCIFCQQGMRSCPACRICSELFCFFAFSKLTSLQDISSLFFFFYFASSFPSFSLFVVDSIFHMSSNWFFRLKSLTLSSVFKFSEFIKFFLWASKCAFIVSLSSRRLELITICYVLGLWMPSY